MKISYHYDYNKSQHGFTLIELMVSLVLGLLVSAAVMQVYIINIKTAGIQAGASELVEDATFNVPVLEKKVRLANLGLANKVKDNQPGAGIVLTSANNAPEDKEGNKQLDNLKNREDIDASGLPKNITMGGQPVAVALLTHTGDQVSSGTKNEWTGASNFDLKSGQLTIQYRAPQNMYDCEGKLALGPRRVKVGGVLEAIDGQIVIERFYLRAPNSKKPTELSLYCDAGKYITEIMDDYAEQSIPEKELPTSVEFAANNTIKDFGDAGAEIITNVDYFDILLTTMKDQALPTTVEGDNTLRYYTVKDYLDLDLEVKPVIVGIKYGLILRSGNAVLTSASPSEFTVLGQTLTLKDGSSRNYMRTVVESDITLRNASYQNK
ncbi:prepilin-type N-terminal cleavage/methylation domain-containing protein [Psychrobacter sp. LV10R520-6]|uniref:prepilin-type N-terminal cleavage/methylation domain-containing protein n=1 Tax=Psychrobacter sp. LV10R520-6 TaxID=1415574 RepID=UPI0024C7BF07|nr:prepilin-type N-terminal cleavage/methylation domain-containing protein [Psychrobacter sp. LV10R520-6]SNT71389.1 prepilin-type N-terminal cleavage/methylation domain-containing protein [Psychrobacter sp. LV10R520-6]